MHVVENWDGIGIQTTAVVGLGRLFTIILLTMQSPHLLHENN